jgi:hypothetical protein
VVVALDALHERSAEAIDGEGAGNRQRFTGRHVGGQFVVGKLGEMHSGRGDRTYCRTASWVAEVDQPVSGVQHAGASAHLLPARDRLRRVPWLAMHRSVELEHRVAAHYDGVRRRVGGCLGALQDAGDGLSLGSGEQQGHLVCSEVTVRLSGPGKDGVLVDV